MSTSTLDRPQMGVMWYPAGKWLVSTPIYAGKEEELEKALMCPHGTYQEEKREVIPVEETGIPELIIVQKCTGCVSKRFLRYPMEEPAEQELFKQSTPPVPTEVACADYERTYNFGTFQVLVRRHDPYPGAPLAFLVIVTVGAQRYAQILPTDELSFAGSGIRVLQAMDRVLRLGPDRYANVTLLEERRMRSDLPEKQRDARELFAIAQALGPLIAQAAAGLQEEAVKEAGEAQEQEVAAFEAHIAENEEKLNEVKRVLAEAEAAKASARELKKLRELAAQGESYVAELKERLRMYREGQQQ